MTWDLGALRPEESASLVSGFIDIDGDLAQRCLKRAAGNPLFLEELCYAQSLEVLRRGGRLCVISFHSLEDRIVKRFMRDASRETEQYRGMPDVPTEARPKLKIIGKPVTATPAEVDANVRARSARLRVAERT